MQGAQTKLIALGIGSSVSQNELTRMASAPKNSTVIRVQNFTSLPTVEDRLRDTSCRRTYVPLVVSLLGLCITLLGKQV